MENCHGRRDEFSSEKHHLGASFSSSGEEIGSMQVGLFQNKVAVDGRTYKYKARLVSKAFFQVQGVDYHETFAPVAKMDSIRLVLAISASKHI